MAVVSRFNGSSDISTGFNPGERGGHPCMRRDREQGDCWGVVGQKAHTIPCLGDSLTAAGAPATARLSRREGESTGGTGTVSYTHLRAHETRRHL
eukprot:8200369-Prorocentrum_lima.AAC.1